VSIGEALRTQRKKLPHYAVRRSLANDLDITVVHLTAVEDGAAYPSGPLLEKWLDLLEFSKEAASLLWKQLALHQLDPVVAKNVVIGRRTR
jgi:hypothetical protein